MPGFLLAINASQHSLTKAVESIQFDSRYFCKSIVEKNNLFVAVNSYQEYPTMVFEFDDTLVLFEGKIYNKSIESIRQFFSSIVTVDGFHEHLIEPWLVNTDGEFVVVLINHSANKILIFNDIFGRLPVYYSKNNGTIVISREISFVRSICEAIENDHFAVTSTILFGYVPGNKTLWNNILRMQYNTFILLDLDDNAMRIEEGERLIIQNNTADEKISDDQLFDLLNEAIINRINCMQNPVLSLSGGLDSRLIAGCLSKNKIEIPSFTYSESGGSADDDLESVIKIVKLLKINDKHKIIDLDPVSNNSLETLLKTKQGLNYLGMGFIIPFLNYFKDNNLQQITGDGGDKILADLMPSIPLRNELDFLNYLLENHSIIPLEKALQITSMCKKDFFAELMHIVNAYRAMNYEEMYAQFLIHERAFVWLFEGEDRNRYFSWTTTPFYSPDFALKAIRIPMKIKKQGKLFLKFFAKLESGLETIPNPNWKLAPNQQMSIRWLFLKKKIKYSLPKSILSIKNSSKNVSIGNTVSEIRQEMERVNNSKPEWFLFEAIDNELIENEEFKWYFQTFLQLWK